MSIIRAPNTYEQFDKIILVHGVRKIDDLAYKDYIENELSNHEYFGEVIREKLIYYPTVTREYFKNRGRLTGLISNGKLCKDIGLPQLNPETDRAMICGSPSMLKETTSILDYLGFRPSKHTGDVADYVIERAFVEEYLTMAFYVTDNCIQCKYTDCIDVFPVDCFHEGENFLVIDPEQCIDCAMCVLECPADAIYSDEDLPKEMEKFIEINAKQSKVWPVISEQKAPLNDADEWKDKANKLQYLKM